MAENKEYVTRVDELGNIHISEEVLAVIAAAAALEVDGVSSLSSGGKDIGELLGKKSLSRGIQVQVEDEKVRLELTIMVKYGYTIMDVAKAVQDAVASAVESTTGRAVKNVNVSVSGISVPKSGKK